jgi:phosphoribosylformylglycinamidine synthase I
MIRALILRAPGINRDRDIAYACKLVGFTPELIHINTLIKAPDTLLDYQFLVIPGGFSYGDDLGAGNLLAKNLTIHLGPQLRRFIDEGRPVLGVCNGFQVLVKAGLLPGPSLNGKVSLRATLTDNEAAQFECRWIKMAIQPSVCIFTRGIERSIESPIAHGEGQFVLAGDLVALRERGQIPLVYTSSSNGASDHVAYPDNPNGSIGNVAGICNARGNVLGLMPHPEDYVRAQQHPLRRGLADGEGDGILLFKNAFQYAKKLATEGTRPVATTDEAPVASLSYAASGVDITAGDQALRLMKRAVRSTHGPEVLAGMGAFAGAFDVTALQKMSQPALVASTDGVGTKTLLASQARRFDTIGYDIVNHSVNDLITQGARPLFFMDYLAVNKLEPEQAAQIVEGVAGACREAGCALLGGETAEMPDVYLPGAFDLAGTIIGVVERDEMVNTASIGPGDVLLGLPSNGLHTNGYSLARRVFASYDLDTVLPELGESLADALLRPHRSYLREIQRLREYLADRGHFIKGLAHITGGGFEGNISRILPAGTQAVIETDAWSVPPLFQLIAKLGKIEKEELYRTFNMGVGMVLVLSPKSAVEARCVLPDLLTVGHIAEGEGVVLR